MKEKVVKQQYYVRNGGSGYNRSFCMSEGLYDASYEHDACGVGMIVNIHGIKSHALVDSALTVLEHMKHRGAEGADNKTGDGAGILLQIPHEFILLQGIPVPEQGAYGTGLVFLPRDPSSREEILKVMASEFEAGDLQMMPLREVPVRSSILGEAARASEPVICQIFVRGTLRGDELELALYRARKRIERRVAHQDFYIVSLSSRLIVYKGML